LQLQIAHTCITHMITTTIIRTDFIDVYEAALTQGMCLPTYV
jgi:hypothetical protein